MSTAYDPAAADPRWKHGYSTSDPGLPLRHYRGRSLTASAQKLDERETTYMKRITQPWQLRALSYYDTIGEINFTSKFLARQISRVRFFPARRLEDGTLEPIESGAPMEILSQIQDPGGGTSQVQYDYGRLMFVTGEGVLFGYDEGTKWQFLWKDQLRPIPGEDGRFQLVNEQQEPMGPVGVGYRVWSPHPRWSTLADAPMRPVQEICEIILLLTLATRATAVTRLTNGMFVIPTEISPAPMDAGLDEDPQQNPLLSDWMEHISNQIEQPGTASARVPFIFEGAYDYLDKVKWIQTHNPDTDYMEREMLKEQIRRLALSLDMSPEDLLGYTDANHWSARSVQLDRWRMFGYNKAELWAQSLSDAYLRPALRDAGEEWEDIVISFDDSQVVISPDRTEDALKAHNQLLISGKAARQALGWHEADAMTGEELEQNVALKLRSAEYFGDEFVPPQRGPVPSRNGDSPAEDGPPEPGVKSGVSRQESLAASARILGAAELALHRCRELAGVRVRHKCPDCADGWPLSLVASALGEFQAGDPAALVRGGADGFREFLTEQGMIPEYAHALGIQLEKFAAGTLYQPKCPELPSGFVASVNRSLEGTHV